MSAANSMALLAGPPNFVDTGHGTVAYRKIGQGDPLLLIHGYPLTGMTWRHMLPELAKHFTCYVLDLPGAGESRWTKQTDLGFSSEVAGLKIFADKIGLQSYSLLANNTGATIARQLAVTDPTRATKLVAIGTEIPNHRPPFIQMQQRLSHLPGAGLIFRRRFQQKSFPLSPQAFGGCFTDPDLITGEFHTLFIAPIINSKHVREGQTRRLQGIEWKVVDSLAAGHAKIEAPVLLIWSEDDSVFSITQARAMVPQFKDCRGLVAIPGAKLFVHEERPADVNEAALKFLLN